MSRITWLLALAAFTTGCPLIAPGLVGVDCEVDGDCPGDQRCDASGECQAPTPVEDAGAPEEDAGAPVEDAGPPAPDAGPPRVDAGPEDAGAPIVDAGFDAGFDAGPQPGCFELTQDALEAACDGCRRVPAQRITTAAALDTYLTEEVTFGDAGPPPCWCAVGNLDLDGSTLNNLGPLSNFSPLRGVTGDLRIDAVTAVNLAGLDELEAIGGNFDILAAASVSTLNLDALEYVAGDFSLTGISLSSISGPEALREICGVLELGTLSSANTLDGFSSLERIGGLTTGTLGGLSEITGMNALVEVDGDLELGGLTSLNDVAGFTALERVGGTLSFAGDNSVSDLAGFASLHTVEGDLTMTGMGALRTLAGFASLEDIEGFWDMTGAVSLPDLDGLEQLRSAGQIKLETMSSLSDIEALGALEVVTGEFKIKDNQILTVEGIDRLTFVDHLRIEGTGVAAIRGFRALSSMPTKLTHSGNSGRARCYADRLVQQALPATSTITNTTTLTCAFHRDVFSDGDIATNPEAGIGWTLVSGDGTETGDVLDLNPTLAEPVILVVPDPDAYYATLGLRARVLAAAATLGDGLELELACVDPAIDPALVSARDNEGAGVYARVRVTPAGSTLTLETLVPGAGSSTQTSIAALDVLELDFDGIDATARVGAVERSDDMSAASLDRCRLVVTIHAVGASGPNVQIDEVTVDTILP